MRRPPHLPNNTRFAPPPPPPIPPTNAPRPPAPDNPRFAPSPPPPIPPTNVPSSPAPETQPPNEQETPRSEHPSNEPNNNLLPKPSIHSQLGFKTSHHRNPITKSFPRPPPTQQQTTNKTYIPPFPSFQTIDIREKQKFASFTGFTPSSPTPTNSRHIPPTTHNQLHRKPTVKIVHETHSRKPSSTITKPPRPERKKQNPPKNTKPCPAPKITNPEEPPPELLHPLAKNNILQIKDPSIQKRTQISIDERGYCTLCSSSYSHFALPISGSNENPALLVTTSLLKPALEKIKLTTHNLIVVILTPDQPYLLEEVSKGIATIADKLSHVILALEGISNIAKPDEDKMIDLLQQVSLFSSIIPLQTILLPPIVSLTSPPEEKSAALTIYRWLEAKAECDTSLHLDPRHMMPGWTATGQVQDILLAEIEMSSPGTKHISPMELHGVEHPCKDYGEGAVSYLPSYGITATPISGHWGFKGPKNLLWILIGEHITASLTSPHPRPPPPRPSLQTAPRLLEEEEEMRATPPEDTDHTDKKMDTDKEFSEILEETSQKELF